MIRFLLIILAVGIAFFTKYLNIPVLFEVSQGISTTFVNLLKLVSIPTIFLSILFTMSGFSKFKDARSLVGGAVSYSLLTTAIAAVISFLVYLVVSPAEGISITDISGVTSSDVTNLSYGSHLLSLLPDNFVRVFLDNNIIGCIMISFLLGAGCLFVDAEKREFLNKFFAAMFEVFLQAVGFITHLMPIAVWGFVTAFLYMPQSPEFSQSLTKYLFCIVVSNAIQGFIALPIFMKANGVPVIYTLKGVLPSLVTAFFSRSSVVALPVTIKCVNENFGECRKLSSFTLPLCATINMNACAQFILTTVLFVCETNAYMFSAAEMIMWVFLAIGVAVGNAGVPMGCYFMVMSCLVSMKVPLYVMGLILPIYAILDMFETALNVWSDICVTRVIGKTQEANSVQ